MPTMSAKWTAKDLPDQTGRTVVVTGATSGLGLVTARELARGGARVVLAVRDTARGEEVARGFGGGTTEVRELDLASLASVRAFADAWGDAPLDVLVNNAGVMATPEKRTADGFELQIGTNHLGHFVLTNLLLPHVTDRVVILASSAHRGGKIRLDDLNWEQGRYQRWPAYQQSKLANLLFLLELQRRLTEAGSSVRAVAAHPGYAATNLQQRTENRLMDGAMWVLNRIVAQSDEMSALPTLYAATEDVPGGAYLGPDGPFEGRGHPKLVGRTKAASDTDVARRLWTLSEELTGVGFSAPRSASPTP